MLLFVATVVIVFVSAGTSGDAADVEGLTPAPSATDEDRSELSAAREPPSDGASSAPGRTEGSASTSGDGSAGTIDGGLTPPPGEIDGGTTPSPDAVDDRSDGSGSTPGSSTTPMPTDGVDHPDVDERTPPTATDSRIEESVGEGDSVAAVADVGGADGGERAPRATGGEETAADAGRDDEQTTTDDGGSDPLDDPRTAVAADLDPADVSALVDRLADGTDLDPAVRLLGTAGRERPELLDRTDAVDRLRDLRLDPDPAVSRAATEALDAMQEQPDP